MVELLKICYAVSLCFLLTTTFTKLFLGNMLVIYLLKSINIFTFSMTGLNVYLFQACMCFALAGNLLFLLATCFSDSFLRLMSRGERGGCLLQRLVFNRYIFLFSKIIFLVLPCASTFFIFCVLVSVIVCRSIYRPAIGLYHQVPAQFVPVRGGILDNLKINTKSSAATGALDWSLVELTIVQYHYFGLNYNKFVFNVLLNMALFMAVFVNVNCCNRKKQVMPTSLGAVKLPSGKRSSRAKSTKARTSSKKRGKTPSNRTKATKRKKSRSQSGSRRTRAR